MARGEQSAPPVPDILLAQARLAARSGVSLDTVLRRYFAGHTLLDDFMVEEAEREELFGPAELKSLLRSQAAIVDRLLAAVSKAYTEEAERRPKNAERRKAERIERLLAGEPLDTTELAYDFGGWHLGMVLAGPGAEETILCLAKSLDCLLLTIGRDEGVLWAWLGCKRKLDAGELQRLASAKLSHGVSLAIGEPGEGITGWRLSHCQARAALSVGLRREEPVVRYADVALLASMLHDDLLASSLQELYLKPLEREHDNGEGLRRTLRAYLAAGRNVSSAAAALGVKRHTVTNRLRTIEKRIGRPIDKCMGEIDAALRLRELVDSTWPLPREPVDHVGPTAGHDD
jgi:hypothetical protein